MHLDRSNHSLEKALEKAVSCALLMVRWTSSSSSIEPYIPCNGPISYIIIQLHHCPTRCSTLARSSQQGSRPWQHGQMKPFSWYAPASCASRTPTFFMLKWHLFRWLSDRGCVTILPCHFHSFFEVFAFCSNFPKAPRITLLTSYHSQQW